MSVRNILKIGGWMSFVIVGRSDYPHGSQQSHASLCLTGVVYKACGRYGFRVWVQDLGS